MTSEAVNGLSRLRNAAVLSALVNFFIIPPLHPFIVPLSTVIMTFFMLVFILEMLVAVVVAAFAPFVLVGLLMFTAWIFRVMGWWSMRRSGWRTKEFYTVVWLAALLGPVVAFFLIVAGVVIAVLKALPLPPAVDIPAIPPTALAAASLVMAIASLIEGVASFDVGLRTKVKLISVGSAAYVAAALALLLPEGLTVASVVGLVANALLAIGFNRVVEVMVAPEVQ